MLFNALRRKLLYGAALLAAVLALSSSALAQATFNLRAGWNLLGNSTSAPIDVATTFSDSSKITSVWKWNRTGSKWAFYAPSMNSSSLTSYAQSRGYDVLTSIASKEGFWVNAATTVSIIGPNAAGVTLNEGDLVQGWNLVGSADNKAPSQLISGLNTYLNAVGKAVQTIWAWDTAAGNWRFYAPSLDAQGGTVLADYIDSKGYLSFNGPLSTADGVWINVSSVIPTVDPQVSLCAVPHRNYGDVTYPSSYSGAFPIPTAATKFPATVTRTISLIDYTADDAIYLVSRPTGCTDKKIYGTNLLSETMDRMRVDGVQSTWIDAWRSFDDASAAVLTDSRSDWYQSVEYLQRVVTAAAKRNIKVNLQLQFLPNDTDGKPMVSIQTGSPFERVNLISDAEFTKLINGGHIQVVEAAAMAQQAGINGIAIDNVPFWTMLLAGARKEAFVADMVQLVSDVKKVFTGKIIYRTRWALIDPRIVSKADELVASLDIQVSAAENANLTVAMLKQKYLEALNGIYSYEGLNEANGITPATPITWGIFVQSRADYLVDGWIENGFCLNGCYQKTLTTDYSVQALAFEAAFEALMSQTTYKVGGVEIYGGYALRDDVGPTECFFDNCWGNRNNNNPNVSVGGKDMDFLNISQSIRNKPAEGIIRAWFAK